MIVHQAVKRSREKAKQKLDETKQRTNALEDRNKALESKIQAKNKEIQQMKDMFVQTACGESVNRDVLSRLLGKSDDGAGPSGSGTSSKSRKK